MSDHTPLADVCRTMLREQSKRSLLGLVLMVAPSFFYNAVFFTYALALATFFTSRTKGFRWIAVSIFLYSGLPGGSESQLMITRAISIQDEQNCRFRSRQR